MIDTQMFIHLVHGGTDTMFIHLLPGATQSLFLYYLVLHTQCLFIYYMVLHTQCLFIYYLVLYNLYSSITWCCTHNVYSSITWCYIHNVYSSIISCYKHNVYSSIQLWTDTKFVRLGVRWEFSSAQAERGHHISWRKWVNICCLALILFNKIVYRLRGSSKSKCLKLLIVVCQVKGFKMIYSLQTERAVRCTE